MRKKKIIRGMEIILLISCIVTSCFINTIKELLITLIDFACLYVIFYLLVIKPINDKQNKISEEQ